MLKQRRSSEGTHTASRTIIDPAEGGTAVHTATGQDRRLDIEHAT
jgi:hypothetical protein